METAQLKSEIHRMIDSFNDNKLLENFFLSLKSASQKDSKEDFWDELSHEQQQEILLSWEEAKEGNTIPHNEALKQIKQWREK